MTGALCPCCGRPMESPRAPLDGLASAPMSVQQRKIVDALMGAYPRPMSVSGLIDAMYFDDPDGGPEAANNVLRQQLSHLRKTLAPYGWTVPRSNAGRGHYGSYRLAPIEARAETNGVPRSQTPANPTTRVSDHRNRQERA